MDTCIRFPGRLITTFFYVLLAVYVLTGCQGQESSEIDKTTYANQQPTDLTAQAALIGEALGIPAAKPAMGSEGQQSFSVRVHPLLYSDAGLLVALKGEAVLADDAQVSRTLWRQISGPEAQILNPTQQQAAVILPYLTKTTDLEFAFAAADTANRVAEAHTRIRVSPLDFPGVVAQSTSVVSADLVMVTLSLAEPPEAPVTLQYRTQDGSAWAGRDYESAQGKSTLTKETPQVTIEITALNSDVVSGDLYFIVNYSVEPKGPGVNLYVALPAEREGTPAQPVDPQEPSEPVEPTEPEPTPITFNINYDAGGRIQGVTNQVLTPGQGGSSVTAVAEPGYRFVGWSDGVITTTRIESAITGNLRLTAEFRRNELWLAAGHHGNLSVNAGPTTATIDWPTVEGKTYNLIVTANPETEIQNYSAYEAKLLTDVTPPLEISELTTDHPVYIALQENEALKAWSSFVPSVLGTDGSVQTIAVDTDGTRYIGGGFTQVSPITGNGVALASNSDYSTHAVAGPTIDGEVHAVASDGYGGWYVGGSFTKVKSQERSYLVHVDAAGQLTDWDPEVFGTVHTIAVHEDVIYIGGSFQNVQGGNRRNLAAFDRQGKLLPWNPDTYHTIFAIAVDNDIIYTGGSALSESYLEAFDKQGQSLPWNPRVTASGLRAYVYDLEIKDGVIYVAGQFSQANDEPRENLAAFDTKGNLLPWNPGASSAVETMEMEQGTIYIGGDFIQVGEEPRTKLAAINAQGQVLAWTPSISRPGGPAQIKTLCSSDGVVYVGGYFSQANDEKRNNLAAFDTRGDLLPWNPGSDSGVNSIAIGGGAVYAGGNFAMIGVDYRTSMAALDRNGRLLPWSPKISVTVSDVWPAVNSILIDSETVYIGGAFLKAAGENRHHLAAFDKNGNLLPWNPTLNSVAIVESLRKSQDIIYVAGLLLWADERASYGLEAFDTQGNLQSWAPVIGHEVKSLAIHQGGVYADKQFFQNGILTKLLESPETFSVNTLTVKEDVIYVGGSIVPAGGGRGSVGLAAFDLQGKQLSWVPQLSGSAKFTSPEVHTLATSDDGIYVGGSFTVANGENRGHLASFDAAGNLLPWETSMDGPVYALTIHDDVVYAGGWFARAGEKIRKSLSTFDLQGNLLNK